MIGIKGGILLNNLILNEGVGKRPIDLRRCDHCERP